MADGLDFQTFCWKVFGRKLWPHQAAVAADPSFIRVLAKARRTGGTELAICEAAYTAFASPGCRVLVLSATQDAARRLTEALGERLGRSRLTRGSVTDAYSTRIRLTNGSEVISLPASQRQVRGLGEGVLLVVAARAGVM